MPQFDNMFEDDGGDNEAGEGQQSQQQQIEKLTADKLSQATEAQVRAKVLAEFMRDPAFSKISEARISNKKIHVLTDEDLAQLRSSQRDDSQQPSSNEPEADFENMDKKQMVGYLIKQIRQQVEPLFKQQMKPVEDQVQQLNGMAEQIAQREAIQEVQAARVKYPDFESFKDKMLELREAAPGMRVEQLYLLAKAQSGGLIPKSARAGSERPTNFLGGTKTKKRDHTSDAIRSLVRNKASELLENLDDADFGD